jgi:hypothetical protein
LQLKKEETAEAAGGMAAILGTSAVAFLVAGLQLEDAQYVGLFDGWDAS